MKYLIVVLSLISFGCFTNEPDTRRTLDDSGYTDVEITGYSYWACGKDDTYHTGFRAKNVKGKTVEGTVCCGMWTKGCTIRF